MLNGIIFNIQHYSIHDGPGIRTSVFLKGCFLRCSWCQNPESQLSGPELFYLKEKCAGCGRCVGACPQKAIQLIENKSITLRNQCQGCGQCVQVCPGEARSLMGKEMTVGEVFKKVKGDELFYKRSKGGVTLTGGEPLFQPDFSRELLSLCRQAGIHTAVETCGFADWEILKDVLQYADLVLFDFKHMNSRKHKEYTGVPNDLILDNASKIFHNLKIPVWARIPVIPGYNDSAENIHTTAQFVAQELSQSVPVYILPYHNLGETKYERLGMECKNISITPSANDQMLKLQKITASYGLDTFIGG
ncbi:MAG TPA: glycyl-radical enzyme activating protein [Dehalococcoidales bacterium]|nr:glycyl-radical enzyme activating protein [Dehalococcoidales bacterium]